VGNFLGKFYLDGVEIQKKMCLQVVDIEETSSGDGRSSQQFEGCHNASLFQELCLTFVNSVKSVTRKFFNLGFKIRAEIYRVSG